MSIWDSSTLLVYPDSSIRLSSVHCIDTRLLHTHSGTPSSKLHLWAACMQACSSLAVMVRLKQAADTIRARCGCYIQGRGHSGGNECQQYTNAAVCHKLIWLLQRQELLKGDSVHVRMSPNPVPTINKADQTTDWFGSLERCFGWNDRMEQKPLEERKSPAKALSPEAQQNGSS